MATDALSTLLADLRSALTQVRLALPLADAEPTLRWVGQATSQLDDYIVPRLRSIEAPLLAVVGGSTGAGKSTLVNSLVEKVVTVPGVIRPTTKAPVLIHHPSDASWFTTDRILPGLARSLVATDNPRSLQTVASAAVPEGLAIIDAPDIDSVDVDNRTLAGQLLSAADLWLFVTSAARYADAVPWSYLAQAAARSAAVAVVVDRVPPAAMSAVPEHLAQMMTDRGLGDSALFAVPETVTDSQGLLPVAAVRPIREWLAYLASNQITRARVVMRTLDGAMVALDGGIAPLAQAITAQNLALAQLRADAGAVYGEAKRTARSQSSDGTLLRGEVMTRWQDLVGTGEFMKSLESRVGRLRDRVTQFFTGQPEKAADVQVAVKSGLETLIIDAAQTAASRVETAWSSSPAGRFVIARTGVDVGVIAPDLTTRVESAIRHWQDDVLSIVNQEGSGKRTQARLAALGVNAAGVALMMVAFAYTAGVTGAEIGIAGGTAIVAQKVLELIFGDEAIRRLASAAGEQLGARIDAVFDEQLSNLMSATLNRFPAESVDPVRLTNLGTLLGQAREAQMRRLEGLAIVQTQDAANSMPSVMTGGDDA
ncbi:MAG: ABC transporter [Propionibacteriaceae bacterium]|jgi:energy-coupling factor transporter ATP-binding protein EcfA2|nr:ABC transporter [Propionibacteriaceae bacterium]